MTTLEEEPPVVPQHQRTQSSIADFTFLEVDRPSAEQQEGKTVISEVQIDEANAVLPESHLLIITETATLDDRSSASKQLLTSISDLDFEVHGKLKVKNWNGKKYYSDYIAEGLAYKNEKRDVVMLFESPSSSTAESTFHNKTSFKFHDWPPPSSTKSKAILGPCRYALMNGASFPCFLRDGTPPPGLIEHWKETIPGYVESSFVPKISEHQSVYAYLPVEQLPNHVNNPYSHYHLAGKDAIHLMTQKVSYFKAGA